MPCHQDEARCGTKVCMPSSARSDVLCDRTPGLPRGLSPPHYRALTPPPVARTIGMFLPNNQRQTCGKMCNALSPRRRLWQQDTDCSVSNIGYHVRLLGSPLRRAITLPPVKRCGVFCHKNVARSVRKVWHALSKRCCTIYQQDVDHSVSKSV